jgi:hypothetical protein
VRLASTLDVLTVGLNWRLFILARSTQGKWRMKLYHGWSSIGLSSMIEPFVIWTFYATWYPNSLQQTTLTPTCMVSVTRWRTRCGWSHLY